MDKNIVALTLVSAFVGGIGMLFWFQGSRVGVDPEETFLIQPTSADFRPVPTDTLSFRASIESVDDQGDESSASIQRDNTGNIRFQDKKNGELTEAYIANNEVIYCEDNICIGVPEDESDTLVDTGDFIFNATEVRKLGAGLAKNGEIECGEAICDIWQSPSIVESVSNTVLIEQETGRIIQIKGQDYETTDIINFTYSEDRVILPINVIR